MTVTPQTDLLRLPLVEQPDDPPTQEQFAKLAAGNGILNLHRMMAHAPALMKTSAALALAFRRDTALTRAMVELVVMRIAQAIDTKYIWVRHLPLARDCGVTEAQIAELSHWPASALFTPMEKAALGFAENAALQLPVSDEAWAELRRHFSPRQIVEITMLVGNYVSTAIFIKALAVPPERA
jgi:alkylhydroperoxidase family enzyme